MKVGRESLVSGCGDSRRVGCRVGAGVDGGEGTCVSGQPLSIEELSVPQGTVVLMWTHAAHGVNPRKEDSDTRWCVVYAYRNPGQESRARWISSRFEKKQIKGAEGLMSLY